MANVCEQNCMTRYDAVLDAQMIHLFHCHQMNWLVRATFTQISFYGLKQERSPYTVITSYLMMLEWKPAVTYGVLLFYYVVLPNKNDY